LSSRIRPRIPPSDAPVSVGHEELVTWRREVCLVGPSSTAELEPFIVADLHTAANLGAYPARSVPRAFVVVDAERVCEPPGWPRRDGDQADPVAAAPPRSTTATPRRESGVPFSRVPVTRPRDTSHGFEPPHAADLPVQPAERRCEAMVTPGSVCGRRGPRLGPRCGSGRAQRDDGDYQDSGQAT